MKKITENTILIQGDKSYPFIKVEQGFVVVDKEVEVQEGDYCYLIDNHYANSGVGKYSDKKAAGYGFGKNFFQKIIASTFPLEDAPLIQIEDEAFKLAENHGNIFSLEAGHRNYAKQGFLEGYKANPAKYTDEDMIAFAVFYFKNQGKSIELWGADLLEEWEKEHDSIKEIEVDEQFKVLRYE